MANEAGKEVMQVAEYLMISSGIERTLFHVSMEPADAGPYHSGIDFYMTADRVDFDLKRMSKATPGATYKVECMARIRARYKDGERITLRDMRSFYTNLTDEEYAATKFQDAETAEWI